jgi:ubiquinone/menaquinone biosynthesis C-methylase UbiE
MSIDMDKKTEWNNSYDNHDNYLFYPQEEVIRFVSKYIRKKTGLIEYEERTSDASKIKVLDLGCGIGRHVMYCHENGINAFGIDISSSAINFAKKWADSKGISKIENKIKSGDIRNLPWNEGYFNFAISHGVLDSMPFDIARAACIELSRVMSSNGLFYCDLISGDDSNHAREYSGEEIISTDHEKGTIQLYFNFDMVSKLFIDIFEIIECNLLRRENVITGGYSSRYHLVLKRR